MKNFLTVLFGLLLIVVLTPLAQFSTVAMTHSDMETSALAGWTVGLLFSVVLAASVLRLISKRRWLDRRRVVILFAMLTIAVPTMNIGLVRPMFLAMRAVQEHFVPLGVNTYRTAYLGQDENWFPVVPTREGLAHNQARRLISLLTDADRERERDAARRDLALLLDLQVKRVARGREVETNATARAQVLVERLGVNEAETLLQSLSRDEALGNLATTLGITPALQAQVQARSQVSAEALKDLLARLDSLDERAAYYVPRIYQAMDRPTQERLDNDMDRLSPADRAALQAQIDAMAADLAALRRQVTDLSASDVRAFRTAKQRALEERYRTMDHAELSPIRTSFVYRSRTQERAAMTRQRGQGDEPQQDFAALSEGVFRTAAQKEDEDARGIAENLALVKKQVPWGLWIPPALRWGTLVLCIFLFLMCLAEWLRRKWVVRENLAFPLVEIADNLIRHDYALEDAEDVVHAPRRKGGWHIGFWVGFGIGALILLMEALGHYGAMPREFTLSTNVSETFFGSGSLKLMTKVVWVLSPILVGILFLVSLEISFSIWALFWIFNLVAWFVKMGVPESELRDPIYTGYGGGRFFPFSMEQLLGASLCFSAILLVKSWRSGRASAGQKEAPGEAYLPRRLTGAGLLLLPLAIAALLWNLGLQHPGFIVFVFVLTLGLSVAAARVRSETGLPTMHSNYEFAKIPMVFGLGGALGARSYASFIATAWLPISLLFRLLPQQLENMELARRNQVKVRTLALATLLAFVVAMVTGVYSFLLLTHWLGSGAYGDGTAVSTNFANVIAYPLWVSHFFGENGLETFNDVHGIRVKFILIGFAVFGLLTLLRGRILKFPFHPVAFLVILLGTHFDWVSPYHKGTNALKLGDASWLWGSAFVAWLIKWLVIKYGGMNTYKRLKPAFIGLAVGAVVCMFVINLVDLSVSLKAKSPGFEPSDVQKAFIEKTPYNPAFY